MSSNGKVQLGRREFLIASSVGTLGAVMVGPHLFAVSAASPKSLAVGFASFDDEARIVPASEVPAGDAGFIGRGARIAASGVSGALDRPDARRAVELLAYFGYFEGAERREAPFRVWANSRVTGCQGNSLSFTVPVDEQRIHLRVGVESGSVGNSLQSRRRAMGGNPTQSESLPLMLTVASDPDVLKLVRGSYVIAPLFENDSQPRWSEWQLGRVDGRMSLVGSDGSAAGFEHFVLRIDYATL